MFMLHRWEVMKKWTEFVDENGNPNPTGSYAEKIRYTARLYRNNKV